MTTYCWITMCGIILKFVKIIIIQDEYRKLFKVLHADNLRVWNTPQYSTVQYDPSWSILWVSIYHIFRSVKTERNPNTSRCLDAAFLILFRRDAKLRKTIISFVMSVRSSVHLSVRMEQLGSHWTDFEETWYLRLFWKSVAKIQV